MVNFLIISVIIITLLLHFILYILSHFDRKTKQEKTMVNNAALILDKLDKKKQIGGKRMDKDLKSVAKFLATKIDRAKEEILEELDNKIEELIENSTESEEEVEGAELEENYDDELEAFEENEDEAQIPEQPKIPNSLDISKRQIKNEDRETKETKKGLFGKKITKNEPTI